MVTAVYKIGSECILLNNYKSLLSVFNKNLKSNFIPSWLFPIRLQRTLFSKSCLWSKILCWLFPIVSLLLTINFKGKTPFHILIVAYFELYTFKQKGNCLLLKVMLIYVVEGNTGSSKLG